MLHTAKITHFLFQRSPLFCGVVLAAAFVLLPVSARAECAQWDVNGVWEIEQKGVKYLILVTMEQNDKVLTGKARVSTNSGYPAVNVYGTIEEDKVNFRILWIDGSVGIYDGHFTNSNRLEGLGYEKKTFNIRHMWKTRNPLKCVRQALKSSGSDILNPSTKKPPLYDGPKKFDPPPTPGGSAPVSGSSNSKPPTMKVPGILAGPVIYQQVYASMGFVVLTWDAGPDHPYAEVWYKVNNGDETFLVEQGKGSKQMPVERGKYYTFTLTDAGQTLATVNVVGN